VLSLEADSLRRLGLASAVVVTGLLQALYEMFGCTDDRSKDFAVGRSFGKRQRTPPAARDGVLPASEGDVDEVIRRCERA
jgi:hypothetical protein